MVSTHIENSLALDFLAYLQVLVAVAVVIQFLLEDVPIPDDIVCKIVMQTIEEHNLPPLTVKHHHHRIVSPSPSNQPKRTCIQYDYKRAEKSVLSDWVGSVPRFPDKQFECTFRI